MGQGRLITFEGGEAGGKSTQIRRLAGRLRAAGHVVRELREPGGTPLGEKIRHLLKHDPDGQGMAAETELLLMNGSRAELVRQVIRPALAAGEVVLCDRFYDSTTAYQAGGRGLDAMAVRSVIDFAVGSTRPDLTLWLRVPRATALQRLAQRNAAAPPQEDRFEREQEAFFERVDSAYAALAAAEPRRVRIIRAEGDEASVAAEIWDEVAALV
ncbi:MAG TPA: dTMP kinase [Candidatus Limnocylindria bacterium]|jgi:dTMP kinase|nr:dTMP kinase [Candidatus Limnocylindria bacterium]